MVLIQYFNKLKDLVHIPLKHYILYQMKCILFIIIYTVASLTFPSYISLIIDDGLLKKDVSKITIYITSMLITGVIMILFDYLNRITSAKFSLKITASIKNIVLNKILTTNLKFWTKHQTGEIFTVINNDISQIEGLITNTVSQTLINIFVVLGVSIYLLIIDKDIGIAILVLALIFCLVQKRIGRTVKTGMEKLRRKLSYLNSYTGEIINNVNFVQASGYGRLVTKQFSILHQEYMKQYLVQIKTMSVNQIFGLSFNIIGICIVLCMGSYKVFTNSMTVGMLFSLTVYVQRLYSPIVALGSMYLNIKNSVPIVDRLIQIVNTTDVIKEGDIEYPNNLKGNIEFHNINFWYEEKQIFRNFSFRVKTGEKMGICGKNGSGKSTILKLLTRLCHPLEGEIRIDGVDICEYKCEYYQNQISCMSQGSFIMSGELRNLMNPFNKQIDDIKLIEYMKQMKLDIQKFEKGLDTYIGENGITISGGEKQKIALIRVLIDDRPIVILDEPTSAIDIESEIDISMVLGLLLKEKTTIIVTHRTAILEICDKVLYI